MDTLTDDADYLENIKLKWKIQVHCRMVIIITHTANL